MRRVYKYPDEKQKHIQQQNHQKMRFCRCQRMELGDEATKVDGWSRMCWNCRRPSGAKRDRLWKRVRVGRAGVGRVGLVMHFSGGVGGTITFRAFLSQAGATMSVWHPLTIFNFRKWLLLMMTRVGDAPFDSHQFTGLPESIKTHLFLVFSPGFVGQVSPQEVWKFLQNSPLFCRLTYRGDWVTSRGPLARVDKLRGCRVEVDTTGVDRRFIEVDDIELGWMQTLPGPNQVLGRLRLQWLSSKTVSPSSILSYLVVGVGSDEGI